MTSEDQTAHVYRFFTEVGIINQLISTEVETFLPGRMTATQFGILGHLSRRPGGSTPLQLSNAFQVPKTSMTHMLMGLERLGFIELAPNPDDKRSKIARATRDGVRFLDLIMGRMTDRLAPVIDGAGTESFLACLPHLSRIREALDRARD